MDATITKNSTRTQPQHLELRAEVSLRMDKQMVTDFSITINDRLIVATGTIAGRWTEEQVKKEFRRNPTNKKWHIVPSNLLLAIRSKIL